MDALILVNALVPPSSAVGMADRVALGPWSGPGAAELEAAVARTLADGATGEPLSGGVEAWPPPRPVAIVGTNARPTVNISGFTSIEDLGQTRDEAGCITRSAVITVAVQALRPADAVTDSLRWAMVLRDTACGGAEPRPPTELAGEVLADLAPKVAGLVVPSWTASERVLDTRSRACTLGSRAALRGDWPEAAAIWGEGWEFPDCPYNLGVKAEIEGRIGEALAYYQQAAEAGAEDAAAATDRARLRLEQIQAMGGSDQSLPRQDAGGASPGAVWIPAPGLTLTAQVTHHPTQGRAHEGLIPTLGPLLGDLARGDALDPFDWHTRHGIDRGLALGIAWTGAPLPGVAGLLLFPGGPPIDDLTWALTAQESWEEVVKPVSLGWMGITPLTLSAQPVGRDLRVYATLSAGVGSYRYRTYTLIPDAQREDPNALETVDQGSRSTVVPVLEKRLGIRLGSLWSLSVSSTTWFILLPVSGPTDLRQRSVSVGFARHF